MVEMSQRDLDELSMAMNLVANGNTTYADVDSSNPQYYNQMNGLNNLDGLRSSANLRRNGIEVLLNQNGAGDALAASPNYFNFMLQVNQLNADVMIRALAQKKSTDLLVAPNVIARSGETAKIKVVRRMFYPTTFEPADLPSAQSFDNGVFASRIIAPPTVRPTQPTDFQEKEIGVVMDVRPQVGPDNYTIDLDIVPTITDFDGFVNYGTPITVPYDNQSFTLSENVMNVPIFTTRRVKTSVQVEDGHTLVLGGLIGEEVQMINDKVPILGDIPLIGRMFRSKVQESIKKNLMIFVTPKVVSPCGELVNPPDPLVLPATLKGR
jgi:general secretion pathway protein D